jgi:hypothetical protein
VALLALFLAFGLALVVVLGLQLSGPLLWPLVALFVVLLVLLTFGLVVALFGGLLVSGGALGGALLRADGGGRGWLALALGLVLLGLALSLPWGLGPLLGLVASIWGLGALVAWWLARGQPAAGPGGEGTATQVAVPLPGS